MPSGASWKRQVQVLDTGPDKAEVVLQALDDIQEKSVVASTLGRAGA